MDFFTTVAETPAPTDLPEEVRGAPIGEILRRIRPLSDEQIQQILQHQRDHGTRFGEAAVALDLATGDEVLDWRDADRLYAGARKTIVQGGDHGLSDFDRHLPAILDFCGIDVSRPAAG